ncbi:MAG: quinone oxidoreductase [Betaproteobacteria bacterium RIFCSPLOWO2_02_FULL_62_17]|nr:MAG: quinone oxidoreductase [Betaproteobacteria bacterium RIFCSPLOWO2_02_FULL_62_17]
MKAIRIHENGGPEVLRYEDCELPPPAAGEARVRHTAIAINFSDVNVRRGGFYIANPQRYPLILGNEAAGVVTALGTGATGVAAGDRVAYVGTGGPFYEATGSYADERNVPARCLLKLPEGSSEPLAAALLLKGLTAAMVINRVYTPKPGDTLLIHAASSGVGLLLTQWSKHLGATVIGTVGSPEKARIARAHGCDHTILYRETNFVEAVKKIVPRGVSAVFDGVGKDTFMASIDCVRRFGMLVNYGNASGHVPPVDLLLLAKKGSLSVSRPAFSTYIEEPGEFQSASSELFDLVRRGVLKVEISRSYPLSDAAQAHRDLESRKYAGSLILVP